MYFEFDEISFVGMSNSDHVFLADDDDDIEKDPNLVEFEFLLRPTLEFSSECQTPASNEDKDHLHRRRHDGDINEAHKDDEEDQIREDDGEESKCEQLQVQVISLMKKQYHKLEMPPLVLEDDDGFRTPTSLDKKIPVLQCPSPPRKPKSLPSTRKKSSSKRRHHFQVIHDFSEEIESLFPPSTTLLDCKIKKARR